MPANQKKTSQYDGWVRLYGQGTDASDRSHVKASSSEFAPRHVSKAHKCLRSRRPLSFLLRSLLLLSLFLGLSWSCSEPTKPPTTTAGSSLKQHLKSRACPHVIADKQAKFSFQSAPCKADSAPDACKSLGCVPAKRHKGTSKAPSTFFQDCTKPDTLCVGSKYTIKTLKDAFAEVKKDSQIKRVHIASGTYKESATLDGLKRPILLEGESNDPSTGVIIEAPKPQKQDESYAALTVLNSKEVTIRRMVFKGHGHGLIVRGTLFVSIDNSHHTTNLRTGLSLYGNDKVLIQSCHVHKNGSSLQLNPKENKDLRFGIVIEGSKDVSVSGCEVSRNGAGGIRISPSKIAVSIDNSHRVASNDEISVSIDNSHRVAMESNHIHHNGPVGRVDASKAGNCSSSCSSGSFCEVGLCHPNLLRPSDANNPKSAPTLLGVGVVIAGTGSLTFNGNSLFSNDTAGALFYSVNTIAMQENAVERNGVRPFATPLIKKRFLHSAVHIWGVKQSIDFTHNLLVDNITTSVQIAQKSSPSTALKLQANRNHFSGNGRFSLGNDISHGDGLRLLSQSKGAGIQVQSSDNYFTNNGHSGIFSSGPIAGELKGNLFEKHLFRALVLHDIGTKASNQLMMKQNTIAGASGYGIQVYGGATQILIEANVVKDLQNIPNAKGTGLKEADAINLTQLKSAKVLIQGNTLSQNKRAGIFLDATKAEVNNNTLSGNKFAIVSQNSAQVTGNNASLSQNQSTALPNNKNPQ